MKKKTVQYTALILVSILLLLVGNRVATSDNPYFGGGYSSDSYYRAKILRFTKVESQVEEFGGMQNHYTQLEMDVLLLEGVMKGETVSISHRVDEDLTAKPYPYTEGEKVLVTFDFDQDDNVVWYLADHLREGYLFALVGAFLFLLILFGRRQGVNTVLSLALTVAAVFFVMLPAIIKGYNIYWVTFLVSCYIIVMTLGVVIGFSPKSFSAAVGCIGGV
ncbi:YibE/F family protein, partial [uncultured Merdimmobilis sp.]